MDRFKILEKIPPVFRNKFVLTITFFIVWLILFDSNNLISRYKELSQLRKLRKEKEFFTEKIASDKNKLYELKTNNSNLEKFAREQYKMKKPDEDLYIVLTPAENRKNERKSN
ncbi:MAG: septum formation inhibitor [Bacteroidales bacterium]|jgi:cell division protein FtsB|nr:septum formation inhibitor [Bacteroidales bacterium]